MSICTLLITTYVFMVCSLLLGMFISFIFGYLIAQSRELKRAVMLLPTYWYTDVLWQPHIHQFFSALWSQSHSLSVITDSRSNPVLAERPNVHWAMHVLAGDSVHFWEMEEQRTQCSRLRSTEQSLEFATIYIVAIKMSVSEKTAAYGCFLDNCLIVKMKNKKRNKLIIWVKWNPLKEASFCLFYLISGPKLEMMRKKSLTLEKL